MARLVKKNFCTLVREREREIWFYFPLSNFPLHKSTHISLSLSWQIHMHMQTALDPLTYSTHVDVWDGAWKDMSHHTTNTQTQTQTHSLSLSLKIKKIANGLETHTRLDLHIFMINNKPSSLFWLSFHLFLCGKNPFLDLQRFLYSLHSYYLFLFLFFRRFQGNVAHSIADNSEYCVNIVMGVDC